MSVDVVAWYLDNSEQDGPRLLALISLAEWADKDGSCHPGIVGIAKRLRLKERRAKEIIAELESAGELLVVPGAGPKVQGGYLTRYYLTRYMDAKGYAIPPEHARIGPERRQVDRANGLAGHDSRKGVQESTPLSDKGNAQNDPEGVQKLAPLIDEKRGASSSKGVQVSARRGASSCTEGVQVSAPKPSVGSVSKEPSVTTARAASTTAAFDASLDDPRIVMDDPPPLRFSGQGRAPPGQLVKRGTGLDAYWILREYTSRTMTVRQMDTIRETVTDLDKWRKVCERWEELYGDSWRKFGHLDWYRDGIPKRETQRETNRSNNGNQANFPTYQPTAFDEDLANEINGFQ